MSAGSALPHTNSQEENTMAAPAAAPQTPYRRRVAVVSRVLLWAWVLTLAIDMVTPNFAVRVVSGITGAAHLIVNAYGLGYDAGTVRR
jgi:hypothetical protein